jgi:hypothetical protein
MEIKLDKTYWNGNIDRRAYCWQRLYFWVGREAEIATTFEKAIKEIAEIGITKSLTGEIWKE